MPDTSDYENVDCLLCGSSNHRIILKEKTSIVKCLNCGLVYTNPRLKDSLNRKIFSEQGDFDVIRYNYLKAWEIPKFNEVLISIEHFIKPGKILDVGCGNGNFLNCAMNRGWDTYGVDLNPASFEPCSKFGKIFIGNISEAGLQDNFFDAIFSSSTFCYFTEPLVFLKETFRILRPGGVIFIEGIPNIGSLHSRINIKKYIEPYPPEQVSFYFDRKHLRTLTLKSGLNVINIRTPGIKGIFHFLFSKNNEKPFFENHLPDDLEHTEVQLREKLYIRIVKSAVNGILGIFSLGYQLALFAKKPE
jgi:SAM-dependent methyltransferase